VALTRFDSLRVFRYPAYVRIWIGAFVSKLGSWIESIAIGVYVTEATGKAGWTGTMAALSYAPAVVLDPFAFLLRVAEAEVLARNERSAGLRISQAQFPEVCRLDGYDFKSQSSLNRGQVLNLAKLTFVDQHQSVIWIGPSGVGKTHLAIGLGVAACQAGYHVRFFRTFALLKRLWSSLADDAMNASQPTVSS
jgi:hypothetical protein